MDAEQNTPKSEELARRERSNSPVDLRDRYCIIGAGPSGLVMAAHLRAAGVPYDQFEAWSDVGGLWDIARDDTPMYESAHFISSKTLSAFLDYPMPADFPDYPSHAQILSYLRAYARHHQLLEQIRFNTRVELVEPESECCIVRYGDNCYLYRGVICASGVNWDPIIPQLPGSFSGEMYHSLSYRSADTFKGKSVLIIGLGNSGADIACDAARSASSTHVSVRRGYYFVPKYLFGKPADVFAHEGPQLPLWLERPIFRALLHLVVGDASKWGMPRPDHALLDSHPLMNDQLLHYLRHGKVQMRPDVREFSGREVHFSDGTTSSFDVVLFATGYQRQIPYLANAYLDDPESWAGGQILTAFSRRFDSLFTLGYAELNGALYPHLSRLAAIIARLATLQLNSPVGAKQFLDWLRSEQFDLSGGRRMLHSQRHAHYCDDLALSRACRKTAKRMAQLNDAPLLPAQPNPASASIAQLSS